MAQTPLLGTGASPAIPITGSTIGSNATTTSIPGSPSTVDAALAALQAEIDAGVGLSSITDGTITVSPVETITVPPSGLEDLTGGNAMLHFLTSRGGEQPEIVTNSTVTGSYDFDLSQGNWFDLTLTGNVTSSTVSNPPPAGGVFHIILRQGGAGSFTFAFPASFVWQAADGTDTGTAPTLHTAVNAINTIEAATADGGTTWGAADEAGGGGDPALGGDLSGTASAAVVEAVQGVAVTDAGTTGDVLTKTGLLTATWSTLGGGLLTVDPGTVTYDDSGADVVTSVTAVWGYDADGPYYDSAGVVSGEEAILALEPTTGELVAIPYIP